MRDYLEQMMYGKNPSDRFKGLLSGRPIGEVAAQMALDAVQDPIIKDMLLYMTARVEQNWGRFTYDTLENTVQDFNHILPGHITRRLVLTHGTEPTEALIGLCDLIGKAFPDYDVYTEPGILRVVMERKTIDF